MNNSPILGFSGEYRFLSNFYPATVTFGSHEFFCNEQYFQAAKCADPVDRDLIMACGSAKECRRLGRQVSLRPDWEELRGGFMIKVVRAKFMQNIELQKRLLATGYRYLEETNTWNDTYWGVCDGKGNNMLGIILMMIRAECKGWPF